ncbi:paraquat-inducible protein A [Plastorhodobacter daqingensis]|uniref:Paraquat-inducible protein A n=1 Tax=Plastorhodobacter daqingensis TaxID=1387281 RepID=A0ABW2UF97_9RHOB
MLTLRLFRWSSESTVSVITGLQALWREDVVLALLVTFLAVVAPYLKTLGLALVQFRLASPRLAPALFWLGRLAMADVFLIAVWIMALRGLGVGRIEVQPGLYLFTGCILLSLLLSVLTDKRGA